MIPHKSCWTLVCFLVLLLLSHLGTVTADNTQHVHELRAVTPATTELTISDPNVKSHYVEMPNYCTPAGYKYGTTLAIDIGTSYTTAAYNTEEGALILVKNEDGHTKSPSAIASPPTNNNTIIIATIVHHMRELAEAQIGNNTKITQVVLTVSGGFDRIPRQVIHQAVEEQYKTEGDTAGLKVLRVLKRHIAAAVAYGFDNEFLYGSNGVREPGVRELVVVNVEETVFDVGVWELDSGVYEKMGFVERRAHGDGGFNEEAADRTVMERLVEEFLRGAGYSISVEEEAEVQRQREKILSDEALVGRLRKEVFKVNNVFSAASLHLQPVIDTTFDTPSRHTVRINIEPFFEDRDLSVSLDLPQWQDLRERSLRTILDAIDEGLEMSEVVFDHTSGTTKPLDKSEVDHVVVMGSSTRTPEVVQLIERYFQGRLSVPMTIEPMFLGVMGAAKIALAFEGHVECLLA